jgi:hypothetical protein
VRKQRLVCLARIAEETVHAVEEGGQPSGVEPRRQIAPGEALSQRVIGLPLGCHPPVCAEDAEITPVDEAEDQAADDTDDRDKRR